MTRNVVMIVQLLYIMYTASHKPFPSTLRLHTKDMVSGILLARVGSLNFNLLENEITDMVPMVYNIGYFST